MQMNSLALAPEPRPPHQTAHQPNAFIAFAVAAAVRYPRWPTANELSHLNTLKAVQNLKYI